MALWTPYTDQLVFEHHPGTDLAASAYNHATGATSASVNGSWTGGAGYQDISGTGPKGLDFGFPISGDFNFLATVVDPASNVAVLASSGTNPDIPATCRLWFDANPANNETVSINGQAVTFKTSGATGFEVNIAATGHETAYALATLINANTATFACTAYCPPLNYVMELTANTPGTAGNSIAVASTSSVARFTARNAQTSVTVFSTGAVGVAVASGLFHSGGNFQARNSNQGTGGLPLSAAGAGYYYISASMTYRDFPRLRVYSGGVLADRVVGTTSGTTRPDPAGNLFSGLTGGGTGSAKQSYAAYWRRLLTDAEDLANYLAVQTALAGVGITVN